MEIIAAALAPVVIIALYIYYRDKYEHEPWLMLMYALAAGAVIVLPIIFAEKMIGFLGASLQGMPKAFYTAFFVAALCEEAFKYAAFMIIFWRNKEFNEKFDGIVYASFISLGFAAVENILYVSGGGVSVAISRAFTAVPAHAIFGITMGYYLGLAKFFPDRRKINLQKAFVVPFLLHGIYDFILMSEHQLLLLGFIPFLIWMYRRGMKNMKELNDTSIFRDDSLK